MKLQGSHLGWAGVVAGAAAWSISTQASYAIVPLTCSTRIKLAVPLTLLCAAVALAGCWMSYRTARQPLDLEWENARGGDVRPFAAWVGTGAGILFALTIVNQTAASLILDGCLR